MKEIVSRKLCTGCSACASICPRNCIRMMPNEEGFLYPAIDDNCVHCGLCDSVCPVTHSTKMSNLVSQEAYAAVSKSNRIWKRSSSGGAFSEICQAWGDSDTLFCGAAWNELHVNHVCVQGIENIAILCKSKYVASDLNACFRQIKVHLKKGKKVLFCGTPCQVAGLKLFLHEEYNNLFLIDLICHGVGSQAVFKECLKATEADLKRKIIAYEFRSKKKVYDTDHIVKINVENVKKPVYITGDRYLQLFVKQDCLRLSCGKNCKYRNQNREGDITIGDFKGLFSVFPDLLGTKKNYSTLVVNTEKGKEILEKLNQTMEIHQCEVESIKKYNPLFYGHTYFSEERNEFFRQFCEDRKTAIEKCTVPAKIYRKNIKGKMYDLFPVKIRKWIQGRRE